MPAAGTEAVTAKPRRRRDGRVAVERAGVYEWFRRIIARISSAAIGLALLAAAAAAHLTFAVPQLGKPLVYDEAAFAVAGEAVARTGLPYGNFGHLGYHGNIDQRHNWALWHPPLYVYALGLSFRLFGVSETSGRLVGVACNVLAALFVFLATREALRTRLPARAAAQSSVLGPQQSWGWPAAAALIYLTNPLVIQSALLLDIDGTVLVLLLTALLFLCLRIVNAADRREWLFWCATAAATFGVALSAKLTSPWALPVALLLPQLLGRRLTPAARRCWPEEQPPAAGITGQPDGRGPTDDASSYDGKAAAPVLRVEWQPWRGLIDLSVVAGGGSALFLASWWLTARMTGMPFGMPFEVLWGEFLDAARGTLTWRSQPSPLAEPIAYATLWISPYLLAMFGWAALRRAADVAGTRPLLLVRPVDVALIAGGGLAVLYLLKFAGSFPKYHIAMLPMWAVAAGWLLHRYVGRLGWLEAGAYALALGAFSAYFATAVQDRWVLFRDWSFVQPLVLVPAAMGLAFVAASPIIRRPQISRQCAALLLLLLLAWSYGVNSRQAAAGTSTAYYYGTSGVTETSQFLNELLDEDEPYVAAKELAWYARNSQYLDQDSFDQVLSGFDGRNELWDGTMLEMPIRVVALFIWDPLAGEWYRKHLDPRYELVADDGAYFVFLRQDAFEAVNQ